MTSRMDSSLSRLARLRKRLRKHTIREHLAGWWFSRKFDQSGILLVTGCRPFPRVIHKGGTLSAENCQFYEGVRIEVGPNAHLSIGNGTYLNRNTQVICEEKITIGRDCKIAWDVIIMDSDLHPTDTGPLVHKAVTLGDRVWVGCRTIILKGVTIGNGAVIAAGSVVTRDVPANTVWAGVPARQIRPVAS